MQDKKKNGDAINKKAEDKLIDRLKKYGDRFYTKKARKDGAGSLEYPFQKTWLLDSNGSHIPRGVIFNEVKGTELYSLYESFSQWVHWTPRGLGESINQTEEGMSFNPNCYSHAAQSLTIAIQSMLQISELVFDHFDLDSKPILNDLRDSYIKELQLEI